MIESLVIPAAGYGTRVRSITRGGHKELLSIMGKPAIQHVVYAAVDVGIKNIVIIIRKGKEDIEKYFSGIDLANKLFPAAVEDLKEILKRSSIQFVYQRLPKGECDAIYCARNTVDNKPFLVIYPDNFIYPYVTALHHLLKFFNKYNCDIIGLKNVTQEMLEDKLVARIELERFSKQCWKIKSLSTKNHVVMEKESKYSTHLAVSGIYIAKPHYFDFIEIGLKQNLKGELTDPVVRNVMLDHGIPFLGIHLPGYHFDIGSPDGYMRCKRHFEMFKEPKTFE